jgi:hypothetical protein
MTIKAIIAVGVYEDSSRRSASAEFRVKVGADILYFDEMEILGLIKDFNECNQNKMHVSEEIAHELMRATGG